MNALFFVDLIGLVSVLGIVFIIWKRETVESPAASFTLLLVLASWLTVFFYLMTDFLLILGIVGESFVHQSIAVFLPMGGSYLILAAYNIKHLSYVAGYGRPGGISHRYWEFMVHLSKILSPEDVEGVCNYINLLVEYKVVRGTSKMAKYAKHMGHLNVKLERFVSAGEETKIARLGTVTEVANTLVEWKVGWSFKEVVVNLRNYTGIARAHASEKGYWEERL